MTVDGAPVRLDEQAMHRRWDRHSLLCQLTADTCELPLVAGPVEATAIENLLVQARAAGVVTGDIESLRALVRATQELRRFEPRRAASPARQPS